MNSELNELIRFIKEGGIINLIGATVLIVIIISSIARGVSALITNTTQILRKKRDFIQKRRTFELNLSNKLHVINLHQEI